MTDSLREARRCATEGTPEAAGLKKAPTETKTGKSCNCSGACDCATGGRTCPTCNSGACTGCGGTTMGSRTSMSDTARGMATDTMAASTTKGSTTTSDMGSAATIDQLTSAGLMDTCIPRFESKCGFSVKFGDTTLTPGMSLTPHQAANCPTINHKPCDKLMTMIMVDPDAPSRSDPKMAEWRHWVMVNCTGADMKSGKTLSSYNGPTPPAGTGPHRYVLCMFSQTGPIDCKSCDDSHNRGKWNMKTFANQNNLTPVCATWFTSQHA